MNHDLVKRIERIEKRNRFLGGFLLLMLAAFVAILYHNLQESRALKLPEKLVGDSVRVNTLVARSIEVVSSRGRNAISLGASDDGWAILSFRDLSGTQKAVLLLTPSGKASLNFFGDKAIRLGLGAVDIPNGTGEEFSLHLKDANNNVIWHPDVVNP